MRAAFGNPCFDFRCKQAENPTGMRDASCLIGLCVAAVLLMLIPAVGGVYPIPDAPVKYFPYIFLVYLAIGVVRVMSLNFRAPERLKEIREQVQTDHISAALLRPE